MSSTTGSLSQVYALVAPSPDAMGQRTAVVLRLSSHLRTNLTFTKALEAYADDLAQHGGTVIVCGLQPDTITNLRSSGLPESVTLLAQGDELDGSLNEAYARATAWLDASEPPANAPPPIDA